MCSERGRWRVGREAKVGNTLKAGIVRFFWAPVRYTKRFSALLCVSEEFVSVTYDARARRVGDLLATGARVARARLACASKA